MQYIVHLTWEKRNDDHVHFAVSSYLVDAETSAEAEGKVLARGRWENSPTLTSVEIASPEEQGVQYITTTQYSVHSPQYVSAAKLAERWGLTPRGVQAHIAKMHARHDVGHKIGRDWYMTKTEAERYPPAPVGRPRKGVNR